MTFKLSAIPFWSTHIFNLNPQIKKILQNSDVQNLKNTFLNTLGMFFYETFSDVYQKRGIKNHFNKKSNFGETIFLSKLKQNITVFLVNGSKLLELKWHEIISQVSFNLFFYHF